MKKIKVLSLILMGFFLVGCVKYEITSEVTKDKKVNFSVLVAVAEEYYEESDGSFEVDDEEQSELEKAGYTITEYNQDGYVGQLISISFDNIDEITTTKDSPIDLTTVVDQEDVFLFIQDGDNYKADYLFNMSGMEDTEEEEDVDIDLTSSMVMTFTAVVPNGTISNNATTVSEDGNTLTWDLTDENLGNIQYTFSLSKSLIDFSNPYVLIGGMGVVALIAIIILIIVFKNNKKNKKKAMDSASNQNVGTIESINGAPMTLDATGTPVAPTPNTGVTPPISGMAPQGSGQDTINSNQVESLDMGIEPQVNSTPVAPTPVNMEVPPTNMDPVMPNPTEVKPVVETPVNIEPQVNAEPVAPTPVEATPVVETPVNIEPQVSVEPVTPTPVEETPVVEKSSISDMDLVQIEPSDKNNGTM